MCGSKTWISKDEVLCIHVIPASECATGGIMTQNEVFLQMAKAQKIRLVVVRLRRLKKSELVQIMA